MQLLHRTKAILLTPQTEWPAIARKKGEASELLGYVAVLALIPALARLAGATLVGGYAPIGPSLAGALASYLSAFAVVYALALIVDVLAPAFGARKDFAAALNLTVYSTTPVWLAGMFLLVPGLSFLIVLGLYGAYLLWAGLPILMRAPPERALPYAAAVAACGLVIGVGLGLLEAPLFAAPS